MCSFYISLIFPESLSLISNSSKYLSPPHTTHWRFLSNPTKVCRISRQKLEALQLGVGAFPFLRSRLHPGRLLAIAKKLQAVQKPLPRCREAYPPGFPPWDFWGVQCPYDSPKPPNCSESPLRGFPRFLAVRDPNRKCNLILILLMFLFCVRF